MNNLCTFIRGGAGIKNAWSPAYGVLASSNPVALAPHAQWLEFEPYLDMSLPLTGIAIHWAHGVPTS